MKSGIRKGILSDESVLLHCADQQSIPLNKMHLAARSGTKISRPQKASYMYQNLPVSQSQKEELISDFVLRSQRAKPLVIPERQYSTLSLDKPNALVAQVATQSGGGVALDIHNQIIQQLAQSSAQLTQKTAQLSQTQNDLRLQQYTTSLLSTTNSKQRQALRNLINALPDDMDKIMAYNVFGVSNLAEFENRIEKMSKHHMAQLSTQVAENMLNDPNNTIDPDDYFSDSAIATI